MPRRLLLLLAALALISALPSATPARAQGTPAPRLITEFEVPGVIKLKFPTIGVRDGTVHVGATTNESTALYWNKPEAATAFSAAFEVGAARGQGDFSSASIFVGPDNTVYYAWGSIEEKRIKLRVRAPGGAWGPERTVAQGEPFPIFPRVAFSQGRIFVIWQDIERTPFAKTSTDGGASFSGRFNAGTKLTFSTPPAITVGPSGQVAFVYTGKDFRIYAGVWNGAGFSEEQVTEFGFGNASISYGPDGKLYAGFRGIERSGPASGAWYAERQAAGGWARQLLASGYIEGTVNVVVDKDNTRHFAWQGQPGGAPQIFYAFQPLGQSRSTALGGAAGAVFNPSLAVGNTGTGFAHVVSERFDGSDNTRLRYYLFEGKASPAIDASPKIEGGAEIVRKKDAFNVTFDGLAGDPREIQWRWGAPPTDAENDSGGWKPFTNPLSVPLKPDLPLNCQPTTLYTRVRNGGSSQTGERSDTVRIDGIVDAVVATSNPYMQRRSPQFSDSNAVADLSSNGGASDGASNYTRAPVFYLELRNQGDCSGIKDVATGRNSTSTLPPYDVANGFFANVVPLPSLPTVGSNTVLVQASDTAGNTRVYTQTFIYDNVAPVLATPGTLGIVTKPGTTVLVDLSFNGVQVTDDQYPGRGFWGVWVANSRTQVADPATDPSLIWVPAQASGDSGTFTLDGWSLSAGLQDDQVTPGTYQVYVRFLDGAGNPTSGVLVASTNLTEIVRSSMYLPLVVK